MDNSNNIAGVDGTKLFSCDKCNYCTSKKFNINRHMEQKHDPEKNDIHAGLDALFPCNECSYRTSTKYNFKRHMDRMHNTDKMGIPDCSTSGPAKKRRLSLKSARSKTKASPPVSADTNNNASKAPLKKSEVEQPEASTQPVPESLASRESLASGESLSESLATGESLMDTESDMTESRSSTTTGSRSETKVPPVSSLENLGNTCFMSSVMQVLRYTPGFLANLAYLFEDIKASEKIKRNSKVMEKNNLEVDEEMSQKSWKVVKNLYKVYRDLSLLEEKYDEVASDDVMSMAVKPIRLLNSIREINAMFEGNMQHDAQEFLRCLLNYLQDAEKEGRKFYSQLPQRFSPKLSLNPIMQKYLQSVQDYMQHVDVKEETKPDVSVRNPECEKVKVNLIAKLETPSETVKTPEDISVAPKIGDTAFEVDNILKRSKSENAAVDELTAHSCQSKSEIVKNDCKACLTIPVKEKGKCALKRKKNKDISAENNQPVVALQRNLMSKRRMGMRGAVFVKSADDVFTEVKHTDMSLGSDSLMATKSETKLQGASDSSQNIKQEVGGSDETPVVRSKSESAVDRMSFQEMFAQFITPLQADDDESVELISDSDSEDIVAQKKRAKVLYESPRRSPRKTGSLQSASMQYRPSPLTGSQSDPALIKVRTKLCLSEESHKEPLQNPVKSVQNVSTSPISAKRSPTNPDSVSKVFGIATPPDAAERSCTSSVKSESVGSSPATSMVMDAVVKLKNCDFIFDKNETSVSASYAAKCLSPSKRSPRKFSSNYLKQRSCLTSFRGNERELFQTAVAEMLNSPVKSRSKYDLIERLFQGTMMLRTRCETCDSSRERTEEFHDVSVPVRIEKAESDDEDEEKEASSEGDSEAGCSLLDLIEASTEVERLTADNKYFCEECQCYVEAEISMHYDVMPDILTLHLKRFSADSTNFGCITKINDHVNIPMTLPCLRYKCPKKCLRPDHKYQLYSIITHSGGTLSSGHYRAYVRALPKKTDLLNPRPTSNPVKISPDDCSDQNSTSAVHKEEPATASSSTKVPVTRRKAGIAPKLPSRFNNSVITNIKVKTFANLVAEKKVKPDIRETLKTSVRFTTEWFECDDETVRVFDEADFVDLLSGRDGSLLGSPYLLFYHKATLA